jgi:hypothetical protein
MLEAGFFRKKLKNCLSLHLWPYAYFFCQDVQVTNTIPFKEVGPHLADTRLSPGFHL